MKTIKRVLSIIISLFMLLPLFPMNIVAYTNGHTSQDAVNWAISLVNSNWGTSENTPNYDGSSWTPGDYGEPQCVDLIAAYWDYLADYHLGINAKDYADINLPSGWYYTTSPSAGDIAVWTGGTWGHVGIVTSVADTYICFVDCNGEGHWTDGNGYRHNDGATLRDTIGHPLGYPTIFIHPDFATTKPKANVDRGADGVYFIGEDCKISLSGDTSNLYNLKIYRTPTGGETYLYWEGDIYSTNYTLHLYEPGYYACSFVLDPYGSQIWSEMVGWIVRPVAPSAPTVSVSGTDVTVSWKDVYGESSYNVYLVQSPWAWEDIKYKATVDADVTTYTFKNIAPGNYRAFIISMPNGTEVQSGWTSFDVVSFGPWDGNNTITPYVGETNAIIGQTINVSDGDPSDSGMYLYDENGNQLASASNGQLSKWWGYVYFDINNELGYVLSELTTYKYKFYVTLNGKTYWSDMGSFTTGGTKITLNKSSLSLQKGETASLTATVLPSGTSVTWSTSNKNVATVSNGTVTAVGTGTATITATANGKTASCAVSVTRPAWEYRNGVLQLYFGEYTGDFFQNFENRSDTVQIIADAGVKFTGSFYNAFGDKYPSCESIDFSKVDTSGVINMGYMFYKCSSLTSLDVSGFDTSNVSDMGYMFFGCSSLTSLDVSGFDTSKVTYMQSMFYNCRNLTSLDVSGFETSNVTNMSFMFDECQNLTSLDVSGFDTSKVTYMKSMFYNCRNLTSLDVSGFETSNVTDMSFMFAGCQNLTSLDVSGFDTSNVTNMSKMFSGCSSLTSLDLSGFDTSNVTNMGSMFSGCSSFTSLDVSGFDTSNVTSMDWMFSGCSKLTSLDVSGFDTPKVTDMGGMFWDCESLTSLDLSGFDTSNVTYMGYMFFGCSSLESLDVSGFDTSNVADMRYMFYNCSSLTSLDVSGFDTSKVEYYDEMFRNCPSLSSIKLPVGFTVKAKMNLNNGKQTDNGYSGWTKTGSNENISGTGQYAEFVSDGGEYAWVTESEPEDPNQAKLIIESKTVSIADESFKVSFTLENAPDLGSILISNITYDHNALELINAEWKISDTAINNWNASQNMGVVAVSGNRDVNGIILELTFNIRDNANDGDYSIGCDLTAKSKDSNGNEQTHDIIIKEGTITIMSVLKGDTDGNNVVNSDDAIYLLYYTFLPDEFPVNQNCDFDGSGAVDSDDAIYLLYYTFLPDMFPLN